MRRSENGASLSPARRKTTLAAWALLVCCALILVLAAPALASPQDKGFDQKTGMPLPGTQGKFGAPKTPEPYMSGQNSQDKQPATNKSESPDNAPDGQTGGSTDGSTNGLINPTGGSTDSIGGSTDGSTTAAPSADSSDMYGQQDDPGGLEGMVLGWFKKIMGWVYGSTIGDLIKKVAEALQTSILGLPAPSGPVVDMYHGMVGAMRPVILVGILVTALLLMLRTSSYDIAYAGFSALPKFIGLGIAFAFLPQFMQILSSMTLDISTAFLPSSDRAAGAGVELFEAAYTNLLGAGFLNILLACVYTYVGFMVILMGLLKNVMFQMLFIAGPFALASSVIPGISHLAASWFRGVLACAAIPILWALELGLGSVIVSSPEVLFGDMTNMLGGWSNGIFTSIGAILILWLMYKTPFKVLGWAFESYDSSRGAWRGLVRGIAISAAGMGIRSAIGGAFGGAAGAAGGAYSSAKTGSQAVTQRIGAGGARGGTGGGVGRGKSIRQITGQNIGAQSSRLGAGSSQGQGGRGIAASSTGSGQQGAIPGGGRQLALPPASPAIEAKYIKKEGTAPGMGKPGPGAKGNPLTKNKGAG